MKNKTKVVNIKLGHHYDVYIGRAGKGQDNVIAGYLDSIKESA
jgi:hypothetical protein